MLNIGIAAIFKNEEAYVLEWLAFHRAMGVRKFFIADNGSNDGTSELLLELSACGLIETFTFQTEEGASPQLPAYDEIIQRYSKNADWLIFIDADEFIVPTGNGDISSILTHFDGNQQIGAVAINWATYGSSGHLGYKCAPVISRFTMRADRSWAGNRHYKTAVKVRSLVSVGINPHAFKIDSGVCLVHTDGSQVRDDERGVGLSQDVVWEGLRINHYVIKSKNEFLYKKRLRGRATTNAVRNEQFFTSHDKNDEYEPLPGTILDKVRVEYDNICAALKSKHPNYKFETRIDSDIGRRDTRSVIDGVKVENGCLCVRGWAIDSYGDSIKDLGLYIAGKRLPVEARSVRREDVSRAITGASNDCGFNFSLSLLDETLLLNPGETVFLRNNNEGSDICKIVPIPSEAGLEQTETFNIPNEPVMPLASVSALKQDMSRAAVYLEYGMGGSTKLASRYKNLKTVGVESDWRWAQAVKRELLNLENCGEFHVLHADIGVTKEWGIPVSDSESKRWFSYPLNVWSYLDEHNLSPDLVLIDGRFRRACFLACLVFSRPGTAIYFDDYTDRPHYHSVEKFLKPVELYGRVAKFVTPETVVKNFIWVAFCEATSDIR